MNASMIYLRILSVFCWALCFVNAIGAAFGGPLPGRPALIAVSAAYMACAALFEIAVAIQSRRHD